MTTVKCVAIFKNAISLDQKKHSKACFKFVLKTSMLFFLKGNDTSYLCLGWYSITSPA